MSAKILFIYNNAFGEYPIIYEYCVGLHNEGYTVYFIGVADKQEDFTSEEGIKVHHIAKEHTVSTWSFSSAAVRLSRQIAPDLIHVFHFRWCYLLPLRSGFFTKYLLDVRTLHVADNKGKHSAFSFLKNGITWMEGQFYQYCIALTSDIKKMLSPSYKKIPVIPLGANVERFQPSDKLQRRMALRNQLNIKDNETVFLYSGTLSPARRIDTIIRAFGNMNMPHTFLVIAGNDKDNPQSIIDLKNLCESLHLDTNVIFTGFIRYPKLIDYYLGADIGLCYIPQTSYYDLQTPTKLFEYMAAGLVTVATNTTTNKAIIISGKNGYICDDSVDEFSLTLLKVLEEYPRTSIQMIKAAHATVEHFSWKRIIKNYIIPYYEIILGKQEHKL